VSNIEILVVFPKPVAIAFAFELLVEPIIIYTFEACIPIFAISSSIAFSKSGSRGLNLYVR
jgi:hypothetical protein